MKTFKQACLSLLCLFIVSCYSEQRYLYPLSQKNKDIIKKTFTSGVVSCTDGYCWTIVDEKQDDKSYLITGKRVLFVKIELKASATDEKSFITSVKVTNAGIRLKSIEQLFLQELGSNLLDKNKEEIQKSISTILKNNKIDSKPTGD